MKTSFARQSSPMSWSLGNATYQLSIGLNAAGQPMLTHLVYTPTPALNWAPAKPAFPCGPVIGIATNVLRPGDGLSFSSASVDETDQELQLHFNAAAGLQVTQHLKPSPENAVWRSWVTLVNASDKPIDGISRFDATNLRFQFSAVEPQAGYMLGWMEGPRADAPGRPALPWKYGGWIPRFLYGENYVLPPPPPCGWAAPVYRLVQERLTKLPLRSGKRSTYENHPWVTVYDAELRAGFFLGFEWSGTWKIDVEHYQVDSTVSVFACSDANVHTLKPGATLVSPEAFIGLFAGDWDDAFNACRRYVGGEILPKVKWPTPTALNATWYWMHHTMNDDFLRKEMAAEADVGYETHSVETPWWEERVESGDFSLGLGSFRDDRTKYPMGLKGVSDHVHGIGMNMGLWFEFERVDIRTANRLRNPWKPEWLVQQKGYPYRSWCQHAFLLCLGVEAAAEWALENLAWAIDEYRLDYVMIDSNEWAVCDDPTHDHGPLDGEWAQTQGMYHVLRGLRQRFPDLMLLNSAGGSQRGDFGMARHCTCMHPHDECMPSAKQRRFQHGTGCMYPNSYQMQSFGDYRFVPNELGFFKPALQLPGVYSDLKRYEWRLLNRIMGYFASGMVVSDLPPAHRELLKKVLATHKRIRNSSNGDRYVLAGPQVLIEPEYHEADNWEVYEQITPERDLVAVFFYRCLSLESTCSAKLKALDANAEYRLETYHGMPEQVRSGADLMEHGFTCTLPETRSAEVLILTRRE